MFYFRCECPECAVIMYEHCTRKPSISRGRRCTCVACGHGFVMVVESWKTDAQAPQDDDRGAA